jgi:hypothetical protein
VIPAAIQAVFRFSGLGFQRRLHWSDQIGGIQIILAGYADKAEERIPPRA